MESKKSEEPLLFKKLKRKFVLTTILTSSAVLVIAFSIIYAIISNSHSNMPPKEQRDFGISEQFRQNFNSQPLNEQKLNEEVDDYVEARIKKDRSDRLGTLLLTLIYTGLAIEGIIALISFYFAEKSIKPVREAYEAQKNFIANASHEIKTPLAVIQANLEAAEIKGNKWLDNAAKKADELAVLNNQLLNLARIEANDVELSEPEKINLSTLAKETAEFYIPRLKESKKKLKINIPEKTVEPTLRKADFVQLLNILIDNAIKYSAKSIEITVTEKSIKVKNDGATISEEKLPHVFDRFYQTDKTKSGVGLGLAIGKTIADRNKWNLVVSSDKKSTSFEILF